MEHHFFIFIRLFILHHEEGPGNKQWVFLESQMLGKSYEPPFDIFQTFQKMSNIHLKDSFLDLCLYKNCLIKYSELLWQYSDPVVHWSGIRPQQLRVLDKAVFI